MKKSRSQTKVDDKKFSSSDPEKRKLLNFENWVNGEVSKSAKFDFQSQFSMSKII
jgi:hypothetical protein